VLSDLSDEDAPREEEVSRRTSGMSDKDLRRVIVDIVRNNDEAWGQFQNIVPPPPGQSVIDATPAPMIIPVSSAVVEQDDDEPESDFDYTEFENECDAVMIAMEKYGTMNRYSNNALETVEAIVTQAYEAIANDCLEDDDGDENGERIEYETKKNGMHALAMIVGHIYDYRHGTVTNSLMGCEAGEVASYMKAIVKTLKPHEVDRLRPGFEKRMREVIDTMRENVKEDFTEIAFMLGMDF
jgi:hypothetical protein